MAIPTQTETFYIVLKLVKDLPEFTRGVAKQMVCDHFNLSKEEQSAKTSSGTPIYASRAGWAVSWLNDADYVEKIRYATYRITDRGKEVLNYNLPLHKFAELLRSDRSKIMGENNNNASQDSPEDTIFQEEDKSPEEILDEMVNTLNAQLANELMEYIFKMEGRQGDTFFEHMVTDLISKMGYGKGQVTSASNDGGIDGIITTDRLGFDPILVQAKRYSLDNQVGRPEVQSFAGALGSVTRGVFITTSSFSKPAIQFAADYPHATISLIDGKKLTELMIEYNVGVSEVRSITIKKMDSDYFDL